jgi:PKD repeat protein
MKLHRSWTIVAVAVAFGIHACGAWGATLRIISYNIDCSDESSDNNITGSTHSLPTVVQAIGLHHLGTNAQQADVMSVEELQSTTLVNLVTQLNVIYGAGTYAYDTTTDNNIGGGSDGLIYNTHTIQDVSGRCLPTGQTVLLQSNGTYTSAHSPGGGVNGVARGPLLIHLRPIGFGTNDDFYMYVSHARSTTDDEAGDARYAEAQEVRSDAKYNLPAGVHILYGGDWNLFNGNGENAYKCLTGQVTSDGINWADNSSVWANTNQTQGYDPTAKTSPPTTTTWANDLGDDALYLYDDATYDLTSRIDIQLPNALMFGAYNNQGGVQLAPDTSDPFDTSDFPSSKYSYAFEVFGNNGTTPENGISYNANNHSLDDLVNTVPNAATVYYDLDELGSGDTFTGSDHYPIFGDYNIVLASPPPVANFSATPTNGVVPLTVTLTDSSSGTVTNRLWNFGDGATSNTAATGIIHTYTNIGVFSVTETVSGPGGVSSDSMILVVSANVDSTLSFPFGAPLSTQTINSGFGDSTVGGGSSAGGSELDAAYGIVTNGMLYLFFTGNVEDNSNHVNVFIADGAPGQNTLNVGTGWNESAMNGSVFSPGFNANLMLDFDDYEGVLSIDQIILSPGGSANSFLGSVTLTNGVGSATLNGLEVGFNDSNVAGVNGNTGTAANATAADAVTTGFEFAIPLSALGNPPAGSSIRVLADLNSNLDDYLSNQFLPGLPVGTANPGAGGTYAGALPGSFNLSGLSGNWFSVSVPAKVTPVITWPTPAAITYGAPLGTNQLDATVSTVVGTFAYTPTNGTVLNVGAHALSVIFTPIDTNDYISVTNNVSLVVSQAIPAVTWAAPAPVAYGTALSSNQLDATANVPGSFAYNPPDGSVLDEGTNTLSVIFTPTDTLDYTSVTNTVNLVVVLYQSVTIGSLRNLLITSSAPTLAIVPANSNSTVYQITGTVMTATTLVSVAEYYIQDSTGGIQFYVDDPTFRPNAGDEVHATGTIEIYQNALEFAGPNPINNPAEPYSIVSTSGEVQPLPYAPILIPGPGYLAANPATAASDIEGSLIVVTNVYFQAYPGTFAANKHYVLTNASGQVLNAEVYTSYYDTGLVAGKPIPRFAYSITGPLDQYGSPPVEWELITTVYADIVTAPPPPVDVAAALSGSGGTNVTLIWTAVPYNYTYSVLSATNVAGPYAPLASGLWFASANATFTDVGPIVKTKFYQVISP